MNNKITFILYFVLLCTHNQVCADDKTNIEIDSIPLKYMGREVVIEAFKENSGLYIQPIAATLLSSKELNENNITSIKEFSSLIPNFFMPDFGSKMKSPVYVRGIGSSINAPSVALYVDGVPYFDRSTFDINVNDVDRVEVLRGPQGTIYGRNTMGGVINIFTKSPFNTKGTSLNFGAGNYNKYDTGISHYGSVDNKIGYSISANYSHTGGYFRNITTNKKADPMDAVSARAKLSWRIQPQLSMHLTFAYEYSDQDGYPYRIYDKKTHTVDPVNYNARSFYRRNMSSNGLQIAYVTDKFKLSSQSSFQFFDGKQGLDQDFSPKDLFYVDFYQRQQMYSQEFNIKSLTEESPYKWQFGVFGFHQNYYQNNDTDYISTNKHALQNVSNPTSGFALYHQSTLDNILIKNLSFLFGIRYDWEKTKSNLQKSTIQEGEAPIINPKQKDKTTFSQVTPKLSVHYSFNNNGLVYFSVAKGYKTGGFNNTAENESERTFDPEKSWSYELGAKSGFFNNKLHLDLCLFLINWNDQQISQPKANGGQGFILKNAGKTRSKGLEFTAHIQPINNLDVQLSYGYTHAKFKDYKKDKDKGVIFDGNYLPMVPRNTFSVNTNYTILTNTKILDKIILNAQYSGLGKLYWTELNDISQSYYGMLNGKVSLVKRNISVEFWAKNILKKNYIAYYFSATGSDFVQKGKPFTCGININFNF